MTKEYGVFFAVLPAQPTITPSILKETCETHISANNFGIEWTHHREPSLVHPQLSQPLVFLEISGKLTTDRDAEEVCNEIMAALNALDKVIGNSELLLVLPDTPIPLMDLALPEDGTAETFDKYGLMLMRNSVDDFDGLYDHAVSTFEKLYEAMAEKPKRQFKEIMQRDENLYDFRLDLDDTWKQYESQGRWKPLVAELLGDDYSTIKCGCVLSMPGASVQSYHSDGVHVGDSASFDSDKAAKSHAVAVFVPLVDLDRATGYNEFWAGSHKYSKLLQKKGVQSLPGGHDGIMNKGDCLVYDYRAIHRGMPNTSNTDRPVCYFLYCKKGMEDVEKHNFVEESVFA